MRLQIRTCADLRTRYASSVLKRCFKTEIVLNASGSSWIIRSSLIIGAELDPEYILIYTCREEVLSMTTTRVFRSGKSQAVRIPKDYQFHTDEVVITRIGSALVLTPKELRSCGRGLCHFPMTLWKKAGRRVDDPDLMIGGHAASVNCILVTNNTQHFARMGIALKDWLQNK